MTKEFKNLFKVLFIGAVMLISIALFLPTLGHSMKVFNRVFAYGHRLFPNLYVE